MAGTATDRRGFLGGSDIASILGVSPWKTALELWEEKTNPEFVPPETTIQQQKLFRRGKRLEPWVIEMIEEEHGIFVRKRNRRYTDPEYPWMECEIDFEFTGDDGQVHNGDVKTINPFAAGEWGQQGTDEIPVHYLSQFMWGLAITSRQLCLVGVLIGADDLRIYEVKRDEELIAEIRKRAIRFWTENVLKKVAPEPQNLSDVNKILRKLGGFLCLGSEDTWNLVAKFKEAKKQEKAAKAQRDFLEMQIKTFLQAQAEVGGLEKTPDRFSLLGPDGRKAILTCSLQRRAAYSVAATEFFVIRT